MAERARALGGELTAENGEGGGFLVDARLPYAVPGGEPPEGHPMTGVVPEAGERPREDTP